MPACDIVNQGLSVASKKRWRKDDLWEAFLEDHDWKSGNALF